MRLIKLWRVVTDDSMKPRDAVGPKSLWQRQHSIRICPEAKLAVEAAEVFPFAWIAIGWCWCLSPGRAGSAGISSSSPPPWAEIRTCAGALSGLKNGSEDVPSLCCISAACCPELPHSGERSSMQPGCLLTDLGWSCGDSFWYILKISNII